MTNRLSSAVLLVAASALVATTLRAQSPRLGPADGRDLPAVDTGRVKVGAAAPDFTLESHRGGTVTLSQFRGKKDVILVFYRGHW
jgi:cytochrome oxidase Cu insertion factor (SCO1/SenC/PrrC family)